MQRSDLATSGVDDGGRKRAQKAMQNYDTNLRALTITWKKNLEVICVRFSPSLLEPSPKLGAELLRLLFARNAEGS